MTIQIHKGSFEKYIYLTELLINKYKTTINYKNLIVLFKLEVEVKLSFRQITKRNQYYTQNR